VVAILAAGLLAVLGRADAQVLVSWDRCAFGSSNKSFACNSNGGADTLVVSFFPNFNFPKVVVVEVFMYVCTRETPPPEWWRVLGAGDCRSGALVTTGLGPGDGCTPIWDPVGGIAQSISAGPLTTLNGLNFVVRGSVDDPSRAPDIVAGRTVELARLVLDHTRAIGLGACPGCALGADIGADFVVFGSALSESPLGVVGTSFVTWEEQTLVCTALTPVRKQTWGAIKALYR